MTSPDKTLLQIDKENYYYLDNGQLGRATDNCMEKMPFPLPVQQARQVKGACGKVLCSPGCDRGVPDP